MMEHASNGDPDVKATLEGLPPKVMRALAGTNYIAHRTKKYSGFTSVTFGNGREVKFNGNQEEFIAECCLVYDLPEI